MTNLRHRLEYAVVLALCRLVSFLPARAARAFGTLVGLTFHAVDGTHRRLAVAQLQAAFPVRSAAECRAIARRTFVHFGQLLVTVLRTSALSNDALMAGIEVEGEERVREAFTRGQGVIVVTGHFGYWELQGVAHALVFGPMSVMARPLDNPYLHAWLERTRCATGNQVIYRKGGLRKVLRALAANECVGMLIDQHIHGADAVMVDFFGRPVSTTSAPATLALRTGAVLLPIFALPLPDGRCRLIYEHPVEMPGSGSADPVRELTQRCTDVLEMHVRRSPDLWLWMHRRWRDTAPAQGPEFGMFPAGAREESETPE